MENVPITPSEQPANQSQVGSQSANFSQTHRLKNISLLLVGLLLFVVVGASGYYLGTKRSESNTPGEVILVSPLPDPIPPTEVACTMEAKICPDGSSVGRMGPNCEFAECPSANARDEISAKIYEGRLNPFTLSYPSTYMVELADVNDTNQVIENVIFKNGANTVDEFTLRVDQNVTQLPVFPYDQPPTGKYSLDGVEGIYLELPQGYGDGGNWKPRPTTYLFFINQNRMYQLTFYGVSNVDHANIQEVLSGFEFLE